MRRGLGFARPVRAIAVMLVLVCASCSPAVVGDGAAGSADRGSGATSSSGGVPSGGSSGLGGEPSSDPPHGPNVEVTRVIDGDTIEVTLGSRAVAIRLIGIDTPETVAPGQPVMCYGPEASAFTSQVLSGRRVLLEFDVERIDRYGRTLAYVWVGDRLFNETLVRRGFAVVSTYPPNVKYVERFGRAQHQAREMERGFWGACGPSASGPSPGGSHRCDPSYPSVCIAPPPPDLDCEDVDATYFRVVSPDPHSFDGNHDGVGCEV